MLQLVRHVTKDPEDHTKLALLFANQSENDILLRDELEKASENFPDVFKVWYTVDRPSEGKLLYLIVCNAALSVGLALIFQSRHEWQVGRF